MPVLSVIIVNYNVRYYLEQCLNSVTRASKGIDSEIIVVDNDSSDGSVEYLEPLFPHVRFIRAGGNLGFSRANNLALAESNGKYVLFLNPDTILSENVLEDCIRFMDNHPEAGAAGVRMLNRDGTFARESRRAVPTPFVSMCKILGLCSLFPTSKLFGKYYMGHLDPMAANKIEIVSGAFMFVRREALDKTGSFDEAFFMYGEDVDLSYRILKAGYENWYIPVTILHYKGESTNKTTYRYARVFYKAMIIFFDKHFRSYSLLFSLFVRLAIHIQTFLSFLANNLCRRKALKDGKEIWLYAGHPEYIHRIEALTGTPEGCLMTSRMSLPIGVKFHDYTVYDISAFTYKEILENISSNSGNASIATYNPTSGVLITDCEIRIDENRQP
ncbi:MAG: glycosyltransferase family 2 protein [Bacteroidaceae bacterium]|nr:glycosyltransferase family 2 protein [Bacteroidaceae bacterium]